MDVSDQMSDGCCDRSSGARSKRLRRKLAILASLLVHAVVFLVLFFWYLPKPEPEGDGAANAVASSDSGRQPPPSRPTPPEVQRQPAANPAVSPEEIEEPLQAKIEQFKDVPDQEKLSALEQNLDHLNAITTDESVEEVATVITDALRLPKGQYAAKDDAPEGLFDTHSAQIHDMTRARGPDGQWRYEAELIDAEGRTLKVPMTAAEGEPVYSTFEKMKKYPFAAGIYRQIVMPMIQKMLDKREPPADGASETAAK